MEYSLVLIYLLENVWVVILLWGAVYLSDYFLTIYGARLYRDHLKPYIEYEGSYELTPAFQKDVDRLRLFSFTLLRWLLLSFILIFIVWWLSVQFLGLPQFFLFAMGALFLREAVVHLRHIRIITSALSAREAGGIQGNLRYARWFNLKLSGVELMSFGVFFLVLSVFLGSLFFLGGAAACFTTGFTHWRWSRKSRSAQNQAAQL